MTNIMRELIDVEQIEENIFRGQSQDMGMNHVYGGQFLCQSLASASRTVEGRSCHSMHAYFLMAGDDKTPIIYEVDRIRDGHSFATRRVVATQHGRTVFTMIASFQVEEAGFEHQMDKPESPDPTSLQNILECYKTENNDRLWSVFWQELQLEIRPVYPVHPYPGGSLLPYRSMWIRSSRKLSDDILAHQCLLAYASDLGLLPTAGLPHDFMTLVEHNKIQAASLDHAIWFHRDFKMDDWLLYVIESPSASNSRGFSNGNIFTRQGKLVASTAQEGLLRVRSHN